MSISPASLEPPAWKPRMIRAGEWTITALSDGHLRLDGGSMWGVVPAALWRAWTPPAADNTILLALRPFLCTRGEHKVIVEPGVGDRWSPKLLAIYRILRDATIVQTLRAVGVEPEEITHVVASHCHWDHIGAWVVERPLGRASDEATSRDTDRELTPLFPNARHYAPRSEAEIAKKPGHARAASYRAEDVTPIERAGLLETYEGSRELLPGLRAHVLGGHSDGVAVITFDEEGEEPAIFWSDVVPTAHHVQPPYIMAYDLDVVRSFEVRSEWLARAAEGAWTGLFYHDVDHAFGKIERRGKRYEFRPE
jgi:glyoxylase-like metal-dependent hydrolase (beta-lactamase superfamily II)